MTTDCCILTTKDFTILEILHDRHQDCDDPITAIIRNKLSSAVVVFRDDVPANVATLSSRVTFSIGCSRPDTRVLSQQPEYAPVGLHLPITTPRGLALLGLTEQQSFGYLNRDGVEEVVTLHEVNYQPEATRRRRAGDNTLPPRPKPTFRVIAGGASQKEVALPNRPCGFDGPGPSAA